MEIQRASVSIQQKPDKHGEKDGDKNFETVNTDWHQLLHKTKQLVQVSFILRNIL